jgi:hypothetical protein
MHDSLSVFFLVCFLAAAALSFISLVMGAAHVPLHTTHGLHFGHSGHGLHLGHGSHPPTMNRAGESLSLLNVGTVLAFLAWFGGIGYLLHTLSPLALLLVLALALLAGLAGATLVGLFLVKVLVPAQTPLDSGQYRLEGTPGRVTASIAAGGVGEITYSKAGTRRSDAARSVSDQPIAWGTEVVILGYQRGVAYVEPLDRYLKTPASEVAERLAALERSQEP